MAQSKRKQKQKAGRHSLLTAEITQRICSYITAGCYDYAAAEACGISLHTFKEWMARGEGRDECSQDKKHVTFAKAIRSLSSQLSSVRRRASSTGTIRACASCHPSYQIFANDSISDICASLTFMRIKPTARPPENDTKNRR